MPVAYDESAVANVETAELLRIVKAFEGRRVLVVGDLVADEYIFGKPERISREAPVLILRYLSREVRLGGAANASHNLRTLGAEVLPLGVVGADRTGDVLRQLLGAQGISTEGVASDPSRCTPVKTRIMAGGSRSTRQQIVRRSGE